MKYTVYKHTSPDGRVYIGATRQNPERRWDKGRGYKNSPYFPAAIREFGWDAFAHEIIASGLTEKEAELLEVELIRKYRATDRRYGFNADNGGIAGAKHSSETKTKIGNANRERVWREESKQKLRAYKLAHPTTKETARKIGDANRGRKHTPETIEKMRTAQPTRAVRNLNTGGVFPSLQSAARAYNTHATDIMRVCKGRRKTCRGCVWAYEGVMP